MTDDIKNNDINTDITKNEPDRGNTGVTTIKPQKDTAEGKSEDIKIDTTHTPPETANAVEMQSPEPPKEHKPWQFKPGQSGNPAGKVPGTRNFTTRIREGLMRMGAKDAQGNPAPIEEALVQKIIKMALDGDRKMIEMIWNYLDGKPPQNIDLTSKGARVGTVVLTPDEERRIEELFAPRKLLEPSKQNGNDDKPSDDGSNTSGDNGGTAIPKTEQPRGAYEGNS